MLVGVGVRVYDTYARATVVDNNNNEDEKLKTRRPKKDVALVSVCGVQAGLLVLLHSTTV